MTDFYTIVDSFWSFLNTLSLFVVQGYPANMVVSSFLAVSFDPQILVAYLCEYVLVDVVVQGFGAYGCLKLQAFFFDPT